MGFGGSPFSRPQQFFPIGFLEKPIFQWHLFIEANGLPNKHQNKCCTISENLLQGKGLLKIKAACWRSVAFKGGGNALC